MDAEARTQRIWRFIDGFFDRIASAILLVAVAAATIGAFVQPVGEFLTESRVFEVFVIALLLDLGSRLVKITSGERLHVSPDQDECLQSIIDRVKASPPRKAMLLENSAVSIRSLIKALADTQADVRLLLRHPFVNPLNKTQADVTISTFYTLAQGSLGDTKRITVKFYDAPAAVRGRHIGDLVALGWYSYFRKQHWDLFGSQNPMLIGEAKDVPELVRFFDDTFEELWKNAYSVGDTVSHSARRAKDLSEELAPYLTYQQLLKNSPVASPAP